jgi:NADPH:quinone reductase-like Zn-dependent oxidoreductase/NADP-dependent 3-hydroxy acid dehydrogenase YdfG
LIVAANVIHATADLRQTLNHAQQLLAPGGLLLLLEMTRPVRWIDLSFGLTDGWWRFVDGDIRPSYPLLNRAGWTNLLADVGFAEATAVPHHDDLLSEQAILLARKPVAATDDSGGNWLIFADERGVGEQLAEPLRAGKGTAVLVHPGRVYQADGLRYAIRPDSLDDYRRLLAELAAGEPLRGIVHLWGLDAPERDDTAVSKMAEQQTALTSVIHLIQGWAGMDRQPTAAPALWLATAQSQPVQGLEKLALNQSPLWGMGRTVALEHPELACRCVDLDADAPPTAQAQALLAEITRPDGEEQIAYRGEERYVARLRPYVAPVAPAAPNATRPSLRLAASGTGVLDDLALLSATRPAPGPDDVQIRVAATALNFRDVMNALAMRDDPEPLGGEVAGYVTAVGAHVQQFQPGDKVLAIVQGGFATDAVAPAAYVTAVPDALNLVQAAALPIAFLTAEYALNHLARLQPGERVLIHAAAGGVGLAAVQVARRAGAVVFGTAGSPEKRALLKENGVEYVFDSRSLDFAGEIQAITGGRGVDVALNSLAGEFIEKSVAALAENGRFLEIGKRDIWTPEQFAAVRPEGAYFVVDYSRQIYEEPALVQDMLRGMMAAVAAGEIRPLPTTIFPLEKAADAFRFMAQARHTGKIVLTQDVEAAPQDITIRADATYLITGGLSGLGLLAARDLVQQGARHLLLMGRRPPTPEAQATIQAMEADGATILVRQGDVSQRDDVTQAFTTIAGHMPPLRGIIHSAGALDDGVLLNQTWPRFTAVMAAKVDGAWHLHQLSKETPLDFFVLFSSTAALMGSAGQSNHAAANAFMDALAHDRRAVHLPGLSINWGAWAEIGAAVTHNVLDRAEAQGVQAITPEKGLSILHFLLNQPVAQAGVMPVDWPRYLQHYAAGRTPRWLADMAQTTRVVKEKVTAAQAPTPDFLQQFSALPAMQKQEAMLTFVSERVAKVIGLESAAVVETQRPLQEMGLDSLMAVELRNMLGTGLQLAYTLPATLVYDYPTPEALAHYLLREVDPTPEAPPSEKPEPADDLLLAIEGMTDEELDRFFAE